MSAAPRRLLLTLRLGEMPEHVPSLRACRRHGVPPAERLDGGPLDRLLRHHGGAARCVRLHNSRTAAQMRPGVAGARRYDDVEQLSGVARVLRVEVADAAGVGPLVNALAQVATVERVCADRLCVMPGDAPRDRTAGRPPALDEAEAWRPRTMIRLPEALGYEAGDPAIIVGLADTGVAFDHAELADRVRRGFDTVDLSASLVGDMPLVGDNSGRDEDADDEVGHGTACAGILRADGRHLPPGGAGRCALTPARVLGASIAGGKRVGVGALSDIDAGMKRLIDLGMRVINMSFGTAESELRPGDPPPHEEVVRYAHARGVVLVAASGNSGREERYFPAAADGVIAVGAVDEEGGPCRFSTRGEHVALCAPGRNIWTSGMAGYQRVSGTSFAAPFVSAVCALLLARAERRAWPLPPDLLAEILVGTVRPFAQAQVAGCGVGIVDALAALRELDARIDASLSGSES